MRVKNFLENANWTCRGSLWVNVLNALQWKPYNLDSYGLDSVPILNMKTEGENRFNQGTLDLHMTTEREACTHLSDRKEEFISLKLYHINIYFIQSKTNVNLLRFDSKRNSQTKSQYGG